MVLKKIVLPTKIRLSVVFSKHSVSHLSLFTVEFGRFVIFFGAFASINNSGPFLYFVFVTFVWKPAPGVGNPAGM